MSNNKKPVSKITVYPVSAAIWRNENAKGEVFYNFTLERSYKDDKDEYQSSGSFGRIDALLLEKVAGRVFNEISKLQAADRAANRQTEQTEE